MYDAKIIPIEIASPCKSFLLVFKKNDSIACPRVWPKFKDFLSLDSFLSTKTILFLTCIDW